MLGVSQCVLRIWADDEKIETIRTPGGQRLFNVLSFTGESRTQKKIEPVRSIVMYSRVSSTKQKDDLMSFVEPESY